jgi:hypothetical protein
MRNWGFKLTCLSWALLGEHGVGAPARVKRRHRRPAAARGRAAGRQGQGRRSRSLRVSVCPPGRPLPPVLPHRTPAGQRPRVVALREWASVGRGWGRTRGRETEQGGRRQPHRAGKGCWAHGLKDCWAPGLKDCWATTTGVITVCWATPRAMALLALGPALPLRVNVVLSNTGREISLATTLRILRYGVNFASKIKDSH